MTVSAVCPVCGNPQQQGILCHTCTTRLERDLGDVAAVIDELNVSLSKMARIGNATGPGGLARERTPINMGALEAATHLRDALTGWARDVSNDTWRPTEQELMVHGGQTRSAGRLLLSSIDAIRRHAAVKDLFTEISDAIGQARRVVDRPADRIYLGQCYVEAPGEDGEKVTCFAELWARPDASEVRCRVCSTEHPVLERRVWLMQRAKDMIVTVKEASSYLGEIGGIPVTEASIRGLLHRGKRLSYRAPVDAKRFRLGDLLDVLMDDQERKSA